MMKKCKFSLKGLVPLISLLIALASGCEKADVTSELPTISSSKVFSISSNAVTIKSIIRTNHATMESLGICWGLQPDPSINGNYVASNLHDSIMYSRIEGLTPNTKYYVKTYAKNEERVVYGDEIEITTNHTVKDIEGNIYNTVSLGPQTWMVENLRTTKYNNGTDIPLVNSSTDWSKFDSPGYRLV